MNALLIGCLTAAGVSAGGVLALLVVVRVGIGRQERAGSLAIRPGGFSAALCRRMLALHASPPDPQPLPGGRLERSKSASQ
jgi:hypothetical protein